MVVGLQSRIFSMQYFGRLQTFELGGQIVGRRLTDEKLPRCQIQPGQSKFAVALMQGQQQAVALFFQQGGVGDRAGGDDAHDAALNRPLAGGRIADLLANRNR